MIPSGGNNGWATEVITTTLLFPRNDIRVWYMARSRKTLVNEIWTVRIISESEIGIYDSIDILLYTIAAIDAQLVDLTFDQLDRFFITWVNTNSEIFIFWYNPLISNYEILQLTTGANPCCQIDDYRDIFISNSDILLFYQRDNRIFYRIQRDRYLIEYEVPQELQDAELETCGMGTNLRFTLRVNSVDGIIICVGQTPIKVESNYVGLYWGEIPWDTNYSNTEI